MRKGVTWLQLFILVSLMITSSFFLCNLADGKGTLYSKLVLYNRDGCDYFVHVGGSSQPEMLYKQGGDWFCFPPLSYCMYYLIWRTTGVQSDDVLDRDAFRESNASLLIYVAYNVFQMFLLAYCVLLLFRRIDFTHGVLLPATIFLSFPFFCTSIQLGNSVALAAILLALAVALLESNTKLHTEIAMLLIAVAAGLKFIPAVFGLIFIKNKDYKRAFRLLLYGVILLFVPFVFFGGLEGAKALFSTLTSLTKRNSEISSFKYFVTLMISGHVPFLQPYTELAATIAKNAFLVVCVVCFFLSKTKWQGLLFLGGISASFLASSGRYTCVYYLPALLMFFYENQGGIAALKNGRRAWLGLNLLGMATVFSIPFFFLYLDLPDDGVITGVYYVTYFLLFINWVQVCFETLAKRRVRVPL